MNKCAQSFLTKLLLVLVVTALWGLAAAAQTTPTAGQNINIASGPVELKDPNSGFVTILGDPFLQRQNEPSVAVSTVNSLHLLAGGNDYRAVDIPFPDVLPSKLVSDAWCGVFTSTDGGVRWQSTLLPGFPQDNKPLGLASPLKGFKACADPTVRPGPGGIFYYSGIAFNRDTNKSVVFIARFLDRNYSEKGNIALNTAAIQYIDTVVVDTGTTGQFLDKTWNAVLLQSSSAPPCQIQVPRFVDSVHGATDPAQTETVTVPAMSVYLVWSRFTGSTSSKIMVTQSSNCGNPGTYGALFKVSESNSINQGTVAAINQVTGDVHIGWRRFGTSKTQPDAILAVKCIASLKSCTKAVDVTANLPAAYKPYEPFDQPSTSNTFRTNSMPAMAVSVDTSGISRVHIAFAGRDANGDARVLMATAAEPVNWASAQILPVESAPIADDAGNLWGIGGRGHQLMPAMTFTEGKLVIAYYFSHFDHTIGDFAPNTIAPDGTFCGFCADADGKFFAESRDPRGELLTNPDLVYSNTVVNGVSASLNDAFMVTRRHTLDVRLAQADVTDLSFPNAFAYTRVSSYVMGLVTTSLGDAFQDFQANPPNLALFANGNNAFIGDYIDVAGSMFVQGSGWTANDAPSKASVHYVVWADNRDVQPPADGNYANFTAVGSTGGASFFDGSPAPACAVGQAGMKDQNIYVSRITQGFSFSVPQNMKPLGLKPDGTLLDRAFTALLSNSTKDALTVRLEILDQPPTGPTGMDRASLDQFSQVTQLDVNVPAHSGIARAIFVRSSTVNASVRVTATQIMGGSPVSSGFFALVALNPGNVVTSLLQPEGVPPSLDITALEAYNGSLKSGSLKSGSLKSGSLKSGSLKSGSLKSGSLKSGSLKSGSLKSGSLKSTSIADIGSTSSSVTLNGDEVDPSISNTCTATASPDDPITDAIYVLSNEGNTIATYTIRLIGELPPSTPGCPSPVQLIVAQPGLSITAQGCEMVQQDDTIVVANITDLTNLGDLAVSVPPGESLLVTIRGASIDIVENTTEQTAPQATPPANSDGTQTTATPLFITTTSLPDATFGATYSLGSPLATLVAIGGTPPYTWSALPPASAGQISLGDLGLTLDPNTAEITGTPNATGTFTFKVQVCDATLPQGDACDSTADFDSSARKTLTLTVLKGSQTITVTTPAPASAVYNTSFDVAATASSGLPVAITTSGVCSGSGSGSATITMTSGTGICTVHYNQAGDANYEPAPEVTSDTIAVKADQTIAVTTPAPASAVYNTSFSVAATASSGLPVTITTSGVCSGSGIAAATITMTSGTGTCSVHYNQPGDDNYNPAPQVTSLTAAVKADSTTTITSDAPDPSILGQPVTVSFAVAAKSPATGTPTGNVTVSDGTNSCSAGLSPGSCTLTLTAVGAKTLTATYAGDNNFNGSSATDPHQVNYSFNGFLSPLTATAGTLSNPSFGGNVNRGSVVPLKWQLSDFGGTLIGDLSSLTLLQAIPNAACSGPPSGTPIVLYAPTSGAAGNSTFRFTGSQFVFNWDTSTTINSAAGCFTVVMQLNDGSALKATTIRFQ